MKKSACRVKNQISHKPVYTATETSGNRENLIVASMSHYTHIWSIWMLSRISLFTNVFRNIIRSIFWKYICQCMAVVLRILLVLQRALYRFTLTELLVHIRRNVTTTFIKSKGYKLCHKPSRHWIYCKKKVFLRNHLFTTFYYMTSRLGVK